MAEHAHRLLRLLRGLPDGDAGHLLRGAVARPGALPAGRGEPAARRTSRATGSTPDTLRAVFITHTHVDHIGGLPMLLQWLQLNQRKDPLTLCPARGGHLHLPRLPRPALPLSPTLLGFDLEYQPGRAGQGIRPHRPHREGLLQSPPRAPRRSVCGGRGRGGAGRASPISSPLTGRSCSTPAISATLPRSPRWPTAPTSPSWRLAHFPPEQLGQALAADQAHPSRRHPPHSHPRAHRRRGAGAHPQRRLRRRDHPRPGRGRSDAVAAARAPHPPLARPTTYGRTTPAGR